MEKFGFLAEGSLKGTLNVKNGLLNLSNVLYESI